jgi:hypothetical protein
MTYAPPTNLPKNLRFAGRIVYSPESLNEQDGSGIRTIRGGKVKERGSRLFIQLGEAVGMYDKARFFANMGKLVSVSGAIKTGRRIVRRGEVEQLMKPDAHFYAESKYSGWETTFGDVQTVLGDFDATGETGALFVAAATRFGWGEHVSDYHGGHFPLLAHDPAAYASKIIAFGRYTLVVDSKRSSAIVYRGASIVNVFDGPEWVILDWDKREATRRVATIASDGIARIYTYDGLAKGKAWRAYGLAPEGFRATAVAFDDRGVLYYASGQRSGARPGFVNRILLNGKVATFPLDINPTHIAAGAGYIAVGGIGTVKGKRVRQFRLFNGKMKPVDVGSFFTDYYETVPAGKESASWYVGLSALHLTEHEGRAFLFYMANGLADVYRFKL